VDADAGTTSRHAPGLPAGGLRRLSQRHAEGALSEGGYRTARRDFIDRVVAGGGHPGDPADGATQAPPRTLVRLGDRRRHRRLIGLALMLALGGAVVYLAAVH